MKGQHDAQRRDAVTRCSFPIYGLDDAWSGRRWIGGWGGSGDSIDHVELAHGDVYDPDAPLVRVETKRTREEREPDINTFKPLVWFAAARSLVQHLWHDTGVYLDAIPSTFQSEDPTDEWVAIDLNVDDESREFSSLRVGGKWVALGDFGDTVLALQVRNAEPTAIKLVVIHNPTEYLEDDGLPR